MMVHLKYIFLITFFFYSCNNESNDIGQVNDLNNKSGIELIENANIQYENYKTINILGDDRENFIGFVKEIDVDNHGNIYVLDDRQQKVFVYDVSGDLKQTLGGRGSGPGELSFARSLTVYQDSLLLISNRFRIEEFKITEDSTYYHRTVQLNLNIKSICSAGGNLFVHNGDLIRSGAIDERGLNAEMIHKINLPDYEREYSFGESYASDSPVMIDRLSLGQIICNSDNNVLIYLSDRINSIHGYSTDNGEQLWKSKINDLNFPEFEEIVVNGNPGLQLVPPENNVFDNILSPVILQNDIMLIQVDRREMANPNAYDSKESVITYLADLHYGEIYHYSNNLGRVIYYSDNILLEVNELFNKVHVKIAI